jgi:hypothetical protein
MYTNGFNPVSFGARSNEEVKPWKKKMITLIFIPHSLRNECIYYLSLYFIFMESIESTFY